MKFDAVLYTPGGRPHAAWLVRPHGYCDEYDVETDRAGNVLVHDSGGGPMSDTFRWNPGPGWRIVAARGRGLPDESPVPIEWVDDPIELDATEAEYGIVWCVICEDHMDADDTCDHVFDAENGPAGPGYTEVYSMAGQLEWVEIVGRRFPVFARAYADALESGRVDWRVVTPVIGRQIVHLRLDGVDWDDFVQGDLMDAVDDEELLAGVHFLYALDEHTDVARVRAIDALRTGARLREIADETSLEGSIAGLGDPE